MQSKRIQQDILYSPRSDELVFDELNRGIVPKEIKERLNLIDDIPEVVLIKLQEIIQKLLKANKLKGDCSNILIQVSADNQSNAAAFINNKQNLIYFTKGLLESVQSEDELAGVIAHELGHIILYHTDKLADHKNKVEETAADNLAVALLYEAGYDPKGCSYFIKRVGGSDSHLISVEDLCQQGPDVDCIDSLRSLVDEHPADDNRIRSMETTLTILMRSHGKEEFKKQPTGLPHEFYETLKQITHATPLETAFEKIHYEQKPVLEKINILTELLQESYPPKNQTYDSRLKPIAKLISELNVNFNDEQLNEAFKCLADVVLMRRKSGLNTVLTWADNGICKSLEDVWKKGGKNPNHVARYEDFNNAMDQFVKAQTQETAEKAATTIGFLANKLNLEKGGFFCALDSVSQFNIPTEIEIREYFKKHKLWSLPYKKHILWSATSANIKNVLLSMAVKEDPFVIKTLGDSDSTPIKWKDYSSVWDEDYSYYKYFKRNAQGDVIDIIDPLPEYLWKDLDENATKEEIERCHLQSVKEKIHYEQSIMHNIQWTQLSADFTGFIHRYGMLLKHYYSLVPIQYPFAEKFFDELTQALLLGDEDFKNQVKDFFSGTYKDNAYTVYRYEDILDANRLNLQEYWPYNNVNKPAMTNMQDPFIRFILNPTVGSIIEEQRKESFLLKTDGFNNPDPCKKVSEIFNWNSPRLYTDLASLLENHAKNNIGSKITFLIELERIAHEMQDIMNLEQYSNILTCARYELWLSSLDDKCNFLSFLSELKAKVLVRSATQIDPLQFISEYRYAVAYNLFEEYSDGRSIFHNRISDLAREIEDTDEKIAFLRELFKPQNYSRDNKYEGYIPDPHLRLTCVKRYTRALAEKIGQDDGSSAYFDHAKKTIDAIVAETKGFTQWSILHELADKVNAQKDLAYYIRDILKKHSLREALSNRYTSILVELFQNECSKNEEFRQIVITFLSNPQSDACTLVLCTYIEEKYPQFLKACGFDEHQTIRLSRILNDYHQNFRMATLEIQTVYLETLLFPVGSSVETQSANVTKLIDDVFPIQRQQDDNNIARLIVCAYFKVAELAEQRLLATAMFVANIREQGTEELSLGKKLNKILTHMGPAGGKLLQAIHSHPQTPQSIKADLVGCKTQFTKPSRWELVELVDECGLLEKTDSNPYPVTNIGSIVGSGSFGVTVFNKLSDGSTVADTFLGKYAPQRAAREFAFMSKAAEEVVQTKPEMQPIIGMIEEGKRSARAETDMALAERANSLAEQAYEQFSLIQVGQYQFTNRVASFIARGEGFKRVSIAHGLHFLDLEEDELYKQAVAKAMIVTQLSLRFAGIRTDLDRHGGNIKLEGSIIYHFDFGAMNCEPISDEDKRATGQVLAQAIYAVQKSHANFSSALLESIEKLKVSDKCRIYLNGLSKDFLALGDYVNILKQEEVTSLLALCLTADTVDSHIKMAFNKELGLLAPFFVHQLKQSAQLANVQILVKNHRQQESSSRAGVIAGSQSYSFTFFSQSNNNNNYQGSQFRALVNSVCAN